MFRPTAHIFDVDGTLADVTPYLHHIITPDKPKNFDAFHAESVDAMANTEVVKMLNASAEENHIIVVTARMEKWRGHTSYWLARYGIQHDALFMRADKDYRPDYEIKKEILAKIMTFWDVTHAVDDNPNVIALWEANNIPTTKIGTWDGKN